MSRWALGRVSLTGFLGTLSAVLAQDMALDEYHRELGRIFRDENLLSHQRQGKIRSLFSDKLVEVEAKIIKIEAPRRGTMRVEMLGARGESELRVEGRVMLRFETLQWTQDLENRAATWKRWGRLIFRVAPASDGRLTLSEDTFVEYREAADCPPRLPKAYKTGFKDWRWLFEKESKQGRERLLAHVASADEGEGWPLVAYVTEHSADSTLFQIETDWYVQSFPAQVNRAIPGRKIDPELAEALRFDDRVLLWARPDCEDTEDASLLSLKIELWAVERLHGSIEGALVNPTAKSEEFKELQAQNQDERRLELAVRKWLEARRGLVCSTCEGKGVLECSKCAGKGKIQVVYLNGNRRVVSWESCGKCNAQGENNCGKCNRGVDQSAAKKFFAAHGVLDPALRAFRSSITVELDANRTRGIARYRVKYLGSEEYHDEASAWILHDGAWKRLP